MQWFYVSDLVKLGICHKRVEQQLMKGYLERGGLLFYSLGCWISFAGNQKQCFFFFGGFGLLDYWIF